jgi:predicted SnoaL-like aldol condensation-catalyzing enzyme
VRVFSGGDYVFGHTEYDFSTQRIGFEVFCFEGEQTVEHWDNIQPGQGPNPSGRSMVDGPMEATDLELTESNRAHVQSFVADVLIDRQLERLDHYVDAQSFTQHNPALVDGLDALHGALEAPFDDGYAVTYTTSHRVLAEGCFVLAVSEGFQRGVHSAF